MKSKNSPSVYAVILAGGHGTRFWPASRRDRPKQFLNIPGPRSLLQETVDRLTTVVKRSHIFVITNKEYSAILREQIRGFRIPASNILLEPAPKNTAPAIAWAAARIHRRDSEAILGVFPSDHIIANRAAFQRVFRKAVRLAGRDVLVTMGIVPTRPETGYGYLQTAPAGAKSKKFLKVRRFIEKPSSARARRFLRRKNYFWNSGMFVWKTETILEEIKTHLPSVARFFERHRSPAAVKKNWSRLPAISIDYGVLEKSGRVAAVPAPSLGWSDLGSWEALAEIAAGDKQGNVLQGDVLALDCRGNFIRTDKRLVAAADLRDLIVIDTPDALLVCPKSSSQKVKQIVERLKKQKRRLL